MTDDEVRFIFTLSKTVYSTLQINKIKTQIFINLYVFRYNRQFDAFLQIIR